jgi:GTP cyclohydrolase II
MDSANDLRRAEELVAEGRRIVQQQKGLIVRLRAAGVDTLEAERTLRLFEANLRRFEEHRDILKTRKR